MSEELAAQVAPPAAAAAPSPPPRPLDGEEATKLIVEESMKRTESLIAEALIQSQKNGLVEVRVRFMDIERCSKFGSGVNAHSVDIVTQILEQYKYKVTNTHFDLCSQSGCYARYCGTHRLAGRSLSDPSIYVEVVASIAHLVKTQALAAAKRRMESLASETGETAKKASMKFSSSTDAKRHRIPAPAAAAAASSAGVEESEARVIDLDSEVALGVTTETPPGGFTVGDESGNCVVCYAKPAVVMFIPCMHAPCCKVCAGSVNSSTNQCPLCKAKILKMLD